MLETIWGALSRARKERWNKNLGEHSTFYGSKFTHREILSKISNSKFFIKKLYEQELLFIRLNLMISIKIQLF